MSRSSADGFELRPNGTLLTPERDRVWRDGLARVNVSLDSPDARIYAAIRVGSDLQRFESQLMVVRDLSTSRAHTAANRTVRIARTIWIQPRANMTILPIGSRGQRALRAATSLLTTALSALATTALVLAISGCRSRATAAESSSEAAPVDPTRVPSGFESRFADVNGTRLHYLIGGEGSPVVLLHGFAQTSRMWHPLMPLLARDHKVIVPDLRGAGESARPKAGYDKKTMAVDVHELTSALGVQRVAVVGHDIGLMVAYAFAAQFPESTERVVLMDAFLPGIGNWKEMWLLRDLWHFHFYGETPFALVAGRERIYLEHFWNDFAADRNHSVPEADRRAYASAFAQPGGVFAGFEYFRNFEQDARDFEALSAKRLEMPVLVIAGEKSGSTFLADQVKLVAADVRGEVVAGSGHWLMDEAREVVMPLIVEFLR